MKSTLLQLSLCFLLLLGACSKESVIPEEKQPSSIKEYVERHFPDLAILQVVKDRDGLGITYEVTLEDSFYLEFNRKGEVKEIKGATRLPDSAVPEKVLSYVNEKYPDRFIRSWELDDNRQEVTLDNGLELVFSKDGDFLRIDT